MGVADPSAGERDVPTRVAAAMLMRARRGFTTSVAAAVAAARAILGVYMSPLGRDGVLVRTLAKDPRMLDPLCSQGSRLTPVGEPPAGLPWALKECCTSAETA